ncbi:hypothetical protein MTR_3g073610 [Medicago truncatula]|uniref:Uncharacterized protein n=1 Tax=Medicago truncatula TaxID=3880 RepID=A0A072UZN5_MEDTR|nr:hypothetical protein MTR_3g073610 [Medicago truncatula]
MNGSSRKKWNLKRFGKWVGERSEKDGDFFENGAGGNHYCPRSVDYGCLRSKKKLNFKGKNQD